MSARLVLVSLAIAASTVTTTAGVAAAPPDPGTAWLQVLNFYRSSDRRRPGPRRRRQWRVVFVLATAGWIWSSWHQKAVLAPGLKSNIGVAALDLALVIAAVLLVTRVRRQLRGTWNPPPGFFDVDPAQLARKY